MKYFYQSLKGLRHKFKNQKPNPQSARNKRPKMNIKSALRKTKRYISPKGLHRHIRGQLNPLQLPKCHLHLSINQKKVELLPKSVIFFLKTVRVIANLPKDS